MMVGNMEDLFKFKNFIKLCQNFIGIDSGPDHQVTTVFMETEQLILSQFNDFLTESVEN